MSMTTRTRFLHSWRLVATILVLAVIPGGLPILFIWAVRKAHISRMRELLSSESPIEIDGAHSDTKACRAA